MLVGLMNGQVAIYITGIRWGIRPSATTVVTSAGIAPSTRIAVKILLYYVRLLGLLVSVGAQ